MRAGQTNIQGTNSRTQDSTTNISRTQNSNTDILVREFITDTLRPQQSNANVLSYGLNLDQSRLQTPSIDQSSEPLFNNNQNNDSDVHNILNTKEFRVQHLNFLRIAYGINDHEITRITIKDRSSITDYLLNWIHSAEVRDLIKEPIVEITSEK